MYCTVLPGRHTQSFLGGIAGVLLMCNSLKEALYVPSGTYSASVKELQASLFKGRGRGIKDLLTYTSARVSVS